MTVIKKILLGTIVALLILATSGIHPSTFSESKRESNHEGMVFATGGLGTALSPLSRQVFPFYGPSSPIS